VNDIAGARLKKIGTVEVKQAIGGDMQMRNWPRAGRTVTARVTYDSGRTRLKVSFIPAGMFGILEGPHPPSRFPVRRTREKALPVWDIGFRKAFRSRRL
jgi:hypothetical protein